MDTLSQVFLVFTEDIIKKSFQINKKDLINFFEAMNKANYGAIFFPENLDGFYDKMEIAIIQLSFPVMLSIEDLMLHGKISSSFLETIINYRKVKIKKGVVITGHEKDFSMFDEKFEYILVDSEKKAGKNEKYTIVNKLEDILSILASQEAKEVN